MAGLRSITRLVVALAAGACSRPVARPADVPASAVWVGGADGGAFVDCTDAAPPRAYACTVYGDATGDVLASGRFAVRPDAPPSVRGEPLRLDAFDGDTIHLQDGRVMAPEPTDRARGVPASAVLAENGVWVDCVPGPQDGRYACELFVAATGRSLGRRLYRVSTAGLRWANARPKIATKAAIFLRGGESLTAE